MSKVLLDQGLCRAYGLCVTVHPEVFALPPGSPVAVVVRDIVDDDDLADVREAVRACPAQAISLVEE
ncbi:ferredoxin [Intrasporangium sp. YIM S08009]|uniref:ferredoxin n=1 Tax=Intrasporangium zincisolvens TaxID=3080018 RepID=UPI002B05A7E5|nr:ferredoxin [Intrasporangium sp. YIM S08009]